MIYRLRRLREKAFLVFHRARPWDGGHDPVLLRFPPWRGQADGRFSYDFLGVRTDAQFKTYFKPDPAGPRVTTYPKPDQVYFELVFVLDSAVSSCESHTEPFAMMELGAGYGPWLVAAHRAVQAIDGRPCRLIGVEMDQRHMRHLVEHLRNNGIDPAEHTLINAAVTNVDGDAFFAPESDWSLAYGQRVVGRCPGPLSRGFVNRPRSSGSDSIRVPSVSLASILEKLEAVDLIHVDIQGEEWRALRHASAILRQKVGRLIVATHSRRNHRKLRRFFNRREWEIRWDFQCRKFARTPFGDMLFQDGILAVVNRGR